MTLTDQLMPWMFELARLVNRTLIPNDSQIVQGTEEDKKCLF